MGLGGLTGGAAVKQEDFMQDYPAARSRALLDRACHPGLSPDDHSKLLNSNYFKGVET